MPHAQNVVKWVLKIRPNAGCALKIAALAHDIERAIPEKKVRRSEYVDYNTFKTAHALNSARITSEILDKYQLNKEFKSHVWYLIEKHEFGNKNNDELLVLRDSDSISFFEVNLPFYSKRNNEEETLFRMKWGYSRLSDIAKKVVKEFRYEDKKLNMLLNKVHM